MLRTSCTSDTCGLNLFQASLRLCTEACKLRVRSRAPALGESLTVIGRLLGHADVGSTARYTHLARDSVREAARVAESIAADMLPAGFGAESRATTRS